MKPVMQSTVKPIIQPTDIVEPLKLHEDIILNIVMNSNPEDLISLYVLGKDYQKSLG